MKYAEDMRIDESALDVECLRQADLALEYGTHYADLMLELDEAIEAVKVTRSNLIKQANEDPVKYLNKEKPNVADIEAYYRSHKKHKAVKDKIIKLQHEVRIAEVAKNEISFTRKAMLEALIRLHGQMYFAGPSVPRDLTRMREERDKKVSSGISKKMRRYK